MSDEVPDTLLDALERAEDAILPPDDPTALDPEYPPDYSPEERVDHVLKGEYPRWRSLEWIATAADTDMEAARSVIRERLAEGEVEVSSEGVRRNRYYVFYERVASLVEEVE